MKLQKSYSIRIIELIGNFSEIEKCLFKLKFGIIYIQIKLCEELKIKLKFGKWILGLVIICLELKRLFENTLRFLVKFSKKMWRKIRKRIINK